MRRVAKRDTRPLLRDADPEAVMRKLMDDRYPIYAEADLTVDSREVPHDSIVVEIIEKFEEIPRPWRSRPRSDTCVRLRIWPPRGLTEIEARPMPTIVHSLAGTTRASRTVPVPLGGRSYDVLIGPASSGGGGPPDRYALGKARCGIVTDANVARHHLRRRSRPASAPRHASRVPSVCRRARPPKASATWHRFGSAFLKSA